MPLRNSFTAARATAVSLSGKDCIASPRRQADNSCSTPDNQNTLDGAYVPRQRPLSHIRIFWRFFMRHLLLFAVLLLSLSWAVAQSYPSQSSSGSQESVKGCLSSVGGTYTLTAKDG